MIRILVTTVALLASVFILAPSAQATEPGIGNLRIEAVDTDGYPQVEISVVAPAKLAELALTDAHVELVEGGQPREVEVRRLSADAQELVLAVDVSGSMAGEALTAARSAATDFVRRAPTGMPIGLVTFADRPEVLAPLTLDHDALVDHLADLHAEGRTALYDGVKAATDLFSDQLATHRTIVVLADGEDNASAAELVAIRSLLADLDVVVYAIELDSAATDRAALEELAVPSDGTVLTAADPSELSEVYGGLGTDVRNRYVLSYRSRAHGMTDLELAVGADGVMERTSGFPLALPSAGPVARLLASPWLVIVGLLAFYASLAVLLVRVVSPREPRLLLRPGGAVSSDPSSPGGHGERVAGLVESILRRRGRLSGLATRLEMAGVALRAGDFIVITGAVAAAGAATGLMVGGPILAVTAVVVAPLAAKLLLATKTSRRQAAFAEQLADTLQLLAGSLRAGHSLLQAIDAVAGEAEAPTSVEFRRIVNVTRVGQDLAEALDRTVERTASDDFAWVAQAVAIHREVGGDLAEVLDTVGTTIRERSQIRGQVKALSAEGKLSALVLMALPVGVLVFLRIANPGYLAAFTASLTGWTMLLTACLLMLSGGLWLRKLVHIQF